MQTNEENISYFVDTYGDMILRLAVSYLKNMQDAEDVVQNVFLTLFEKTRSLRMRNTKRLGFCALPSMPVKTN